MGLSLIKQAKMRGETDVSGLSLSCHTEKRLSTWSTGKCHSFKQKESRVVTLSTKQTKLKGEVDISGILQSGQIENTLSRWGIDKRHSLKQKEARDEADGYLLIQNNNYQGKTDEASLLTAEKRLRELKMKCPPGFKKFESNVKWQTLDPETALLLWEDIFKPLYTFDLVSNVLAESKTKKSQ